MPDAARAHAQGVTPADLLGELAAESADLDAVVAAAPSLAVPTPAAGWTVADQIAHLAWTDDVAIVAAAEPERFGAELIPAALADPDGYVGDGLARWAARPDLLDAWRAGRARLAATLQAVPDGTRLPWFGPPMSVASMATARLMETWAHGQDVADALGVRRTPTDRLRHVAHLGFRTRDFAFAAHGLAAPAEPFRLELVAPSGELWTWGPVEAVQRVTGPALDFCLLVTQRRHRADLAVVAQGADAERWLTVAQAFAGPPGTGRTAGQFA